MKRQKDFTVRFYIKKQYGVILSASKDGAVGLPAMVRQAHHDTFLSSLSFYRLLLSRGELQDTAKAQSFIGVCKSFVMGRQQMGLTFIGSVMHWRQIFHSVQH